VRMPPAGCGSRPAVRPASRHPSRSCGESSRPLRHAGRPPAVSRRGGTVAARAFPPARGRRSPRRRSPRRRSACCAGRPSRRATASQTSPQPIARPGARLHRDQAARTSAITTTTTITTTPTTSAASPHEAGPVAVSAAAECWRRSHRVAQPR
jgi:hypothetical protein